MLFVQACKLSYSYFSSLKLSYKELYFYTHIICRRAFKAKGWSGSKLGGSDEVYVEGCGFVSLNSQRDLGHNID